MYESEELNSPSLQRVVKPSAVDNLSNENKVELSQMYQSPSVHSSQMPPGPASPQHSFGAATTPKTSATMSIKSIKSTTSQPKSQTTPSNKSENIEQTIVEESVSNLKPQGKRLSDRVSEVTKIVKKISRDVEPELKTSAKASIMSNKNQRPSIKSDNLKQTIEETVSSLEPQGKSLSEHVGELTDTVKNLSQDSDPEANTITTNIDKIATMSKVLTDEANALRQSIKYLSEDIARTKLDLCFCENEEDVNFPYHLFLLEIIINKIHMKCECFNIDYNNLVISAQFLGKTPIILYDQSFGEIDNFCKLNLGKSTLFAMTYDKICSIKEFEILLQLTKQPPCSSCVTQIGETRMNYTSEFNTLREELCRKWTEEQPTDNILCTTSTPLSKNMYYLSCGNNENRDSIGIIEVTVRMSFLGKEITTAFCASPRPQGTSFLLKEDNGMTMYSCQRVEMDDQGKILLDEGVMSKKGAPLCTPSTASKRAESPSSSVVSRRSYRAARYYNNRNNNNYAGLGEFRIRDLNDEINKLMREKRHWEVQIKALGGPDHARVGPKMLDQDGKEVPGNRGYKYFGAAKDLPGVRELFEQEPPPPPRRTRADLMRDVDADYYGYRDDDDGLLLPLEEVAEKEAIARAVAEWKQNKENNKEQNLPEEENIYPEDPEDKRIEDDDEEPRTVTSHVAVPSQKDIEEALLRRKKQELLEKFGCLDVKMEES